MKVTSDSPISTASSKAPEGCYALNVSECLGVPYTFTSMPNLVGHSSLQHALDDFEAQYDGVLHLPCSSLLKEFVCSLYFPPCTETYRKLVLSLGQNITNKQRLLVSDKSVPAITKVAKAVNDWG